MVINIGALRGGEQDSSSEDIQPPSSRLAHDHGAIVKVIIETALLDEEQKILACSLAQEAGADFVKTSTGFSAKPAPPSRISRSCAAPSGPAMGSRPPEASARWKICGAMVAAGATRVGASASVPAIVGGDRGLTWPAPRVKPAVRFRERSELLDFLLEVATLTSETLDLDRAARQRRRDRPPRHPLRSVRHSAFQRQAQRPAHPLCRRSSRRSGAQLRSRLGEGIVGAAAATPRARSRAPTARRPALSPHLRHRAQRAQRAHDRAQAAGRRDRRAVDAAPGAFRITTARCCA